MADQEIIKARVWWKVGTLEEWEANDLILGPGEAAVVTNDSGDPFQMKWGVGSKRFSDLPWFIQPTGVPVDVDTSHTFTPGVPEFAIPNESGNYGPGAGVDVDLSEGVTYLIWNGSSLGKIVFPINLSGYAKKQDVAPLVWGVGDEHKNVFLWTDANLQTHLKLHPDSWPIQQRIDQNFDLAFADPQGNILLAVDKRGKLYPEQSEGDMPSPPPTAPTDTIRAEDITQPSDIIADSMWNQWIEPLAERDAEGNLWICSLGFRGNLYVTKQSPNGITKRVKIGAVTSIGGGFNSNDHNCGAVLLDDRPGADYPVTIFQADHDTAPLRYFRFANKDVDTWGTSTGTVTTSGNVSYSQAFRFGDEIFVFSRYSPQPRPWRVNYSSDNGDTWTSRDIFAGDEGRIYMLFRKKDDGSGIHIVAASHPLHGTNHNVYFAELDFTTGEVTAPGVGTVISDIRAAIANPSFDPINPYDDFAEVYEATGTETTRLWDVSRNPSGDVAVAITSIPSMSPSLATFRGSKHIVAVVNRSTGSTTHVEVGDAGTPIENPKGANFYFAGYGFYNSERAIVCKWESNAQADPDSFDASDDTGITTVEVVNFSNPSNVTRRLVCKSDRKVIRPFSASGRVLMVEANFYDHYRNWFSRVLINDFITIDR